MNAKVTRSLKTKTALFLFVLCCTGAHAADYPAEPHSIQDVVKVGNGTQSIDLAGNSGASKTISALRDNVNAHSFNVISFYVQVAEVTEAVEIRDERPRNQFQITTADYDGEMIVSACYLVKPKNQKTYDMIVLERQIVTSYADISVVVARIYRLKYLADESRYLYELIQKFSCKNKYRSADDAISEVVSH